MPWTCHPGYHSGTYQSHNAFTLAYPLVCHCVSVGFNSELVTCFHLYINKLNRFTCIHASSNSSTSCKCIRYVVCLLLSMTVIFVTLNLYI